jgi:long-subunit fatty acid transport protein
MVSIALLALDSAYAAGQINIQPFADFDFSLNPPGARAAGMGGVFVPLADDATAAESNPAGLTTLLRPEMSFEFKGIEFRTSVSEAAGGGPGGSDFSSRVGSPAFASAVMPLGRFSFSAFRAEIVNQRGRNFGRGFGETDSTGRTRQIVAPFTNDLHVRVTDYGIAAAFRFSPSLSVGAAGGYSRLDLELDHGRYQVQYFDPAFRFGSGRIAGEDGKAGAPFLTIGATFRAGDYTTLGAVYSFRPRFEDVGLRSLISDTTRHFVYNVPDSYAAGAAVRLSEVWTLAGEVAFLRYSDLSAEFVDFFSTEQKTSADFRSEDGIDLKVGTEYIVFAGDYPLAVRAGAASVAPSNIYFTGLEDGTRALFGTSPENRTEVYTVGLGLAQLFGRLNFDIAGKFGEGRRELSTSLVFRFE